MSRHTYYSNNAIIECSSGDFGSESRLILTRMEPMFYRPPFCFEVSNHVEVLRRFDRRRSFQIWLEMAKSPSFTIEKSEFIINGSVLIPYK